MDQLPTIADDAREGDLPTVDDFQQVVALTQRPEPLYIRYSEGPDRDREGPSRDYESGLCLPGLSVAVLTPPDWWTLPADDWVARRMRMYAHLLEAPRDTRPWLLTGRVVGAGPDHEPLVAEARPLAWVGSAAFDEAVRIYHERFEVGQDSRDTAAPPDDPA